MQFIFLIYFTLPVGYVDFQAKGLSMRNLISRDFHILEHERITAYYQVLTAGSGNIPKKNFIGYDIGKLLLIGIIGHFFIEILKNGWTKVIFRMIGIIYMKVFYGDLFGHITGVAKIVLPGIGTTN